jgi:hypothetical protein
MELNEYLLYHSCFHPGKQECAIRSSGKKTAGKIYCRQSFYVVSPAQSLSLAFADTEHAGWQLSNQE